jgi:hypothetical protein
MTPEENIEIERAIAVKINAMETKAAEIGLLGAEIDALASNDFIVAYDPLAAAKAADKGASVLQMVTRLKLRIGNFHKASQDMINTATFPRPRTGK